jgi:catechol 2,3-dioxygenase-like lactoylglutathione lyase family enzyme
VTFLAGHPSVVTLVRERQVARTRYAEAMIAAGAAVEALRMLELWVAESPFDEAAHALLIQALHQAGQRSQAFAAYRAVRRRLVDELGVEPGAELTAAYAASLDAAGRPPVTGNLPNPEALHLFRAFGDRVNGAGGIGAASPFFIVAELPRALAFYRDRLGFDVTLTAADFFAVVRRNEAQFMLKVVGIGPQPNRTRHPYARWDAFVYVPDPDELAAEFEGRDVAFSAPLADTDDGLRGFEVLDADGYLLFFGCPR